mmetsp:Transcript_31806/g.56144  ORF Transcript_31806/g.56144 Transcript_31806/m.56144 type:complete len:136 (+) Transcript_31806:63-470(+)
MTWPRLLFTVFAALAGIIRASGAASSALHGQLRVRAVREWKALSAASSEHPGNEVVAAAARDGRVPVLKAANDLRATADGAVQYMKDVESAREDVPKMFKAIDDFAASYHASLRKLEAAVDTGKSGAAASPAPAP